MLIYLTWDLNSPPVMLLDLLMCFLPLCTTAARCSTAALQSTLVPTRHCCVLLQSYLHLSSRYKPYTNFNNVVSSVSQSVKELQKFKFIVFLAHF